MHIAKGQDIAMSGACFSVSWHGRKLGRIGPHFKIAVGVLRYRPLKGTITTSIGEVVQYNIPSGGEQDFEYDQADVANGIDFTYD